MKDFYKNLISKTEVKKEKDQEGVEHKNELLQVKDERVIPKLRVSFPKQVHRRWKKRRR